MPRQCDAALKGFEGVIQGEITSLHLLYQLLQFGKRLFKGDIISYGCVGFFFAHRIMILLIDFILMSAGIFSKSPCIGSSLRRVIEMLRPQQFFYSRTGS